MAVTVNLKPSGFQPVGGGQLIYQFTEASVTSKPNYRIELEFNGLSLPVFGFRPDAALVIYCDIAPILAGVLALSADVADRLKNTYVSYQSKWDGATVGDGAVPGEDTQVDLTGDVIYFYVGNNHALNYRSKFDVAVGDANANPDLATGIFLSENTITLYKNRIGYIDFLCDGSLPSDAHVKLYDTSDSLSYDNILDGSSASLNSIAITPTSTGVWHFRIKNDADTLTYAQLTINVIEECSNPIYLRWINDYGGLQHWMFDYNQLYGFQISTNKRNKELDLNAYGITFEQWLMFNELQRDGLIYNDNYKSGQFVEDVTDYSNSVKVIVIPREQSTQTKRVRHNFDLTIRYPEIPNGRVTT